MVVVSLNLLDPLLDAMEEPQAQPMAADRARRGGGLQSAPRQPGRNHRRVSGPAVALRELPRADGRHQPDRPAARAAGGLPRGREGVRSSHGRAHRPLAAAAAGAVRTQSGAGRQRTLGRHLRPGRGGARGGRRQLRVGRLGNGQPVSAAANRGRGVYREDYGRRSMDGHAPHPSAPPPSQHQAPHAPLRPEAAEEGEDSRRVGQPTERREHLLVSSGRPGDRRLRPLPETEREEHPFRGARAGRAVHHVDSGRDRHARDHSQVVRGPDLRAAVPEDPRRGRLGGRDLRRRPRQPLSLPDHLARREPERVGHGFLFDARRSTTWWGPGSGGPNTADFS